MSSTYKENVADTRESPVREIVKELKEFGVAVYGYDSLLSREEILERFSFSTGFLFPKKKKCVDVRGMFNEEAAKGKGFYYRGL